MGFPLQVTTNRTRDSSLFTRYLETGGNFIDTADGYTGGTSEEMLGRFIKETKSRDRVVLATKFPFNRQEGNPNAGGDGRKAQSARQARSRTNAIALCSARP
jgi:aryl-alcohol dehydrogenase-like predicted oxidoreductase